MAVRHDAEGQALRPAVSEPARVSDQGIDHLVADSRGDQVVWNAARDT